MISRFVRTVMLLTCALSVAHSVDSAEEPVEKGVSVAEREPEELRKALERNVSFEMAETPFQECLAFLGSMTEVTLICKTELMRDKSVTMKAAQTPLRNALQTLAGKIGARLTYRCGAYVIAKEPSGASPSSDAVTGLSTRKVSFSFIDVPLREAADGIAKLGQTRVLVDPEIKDLRVCLSVRKMEARHAVYWLAYLADVAIERLPDGVKLVSTAPPASKSR